uniref:Uncharacterized protein LOC111127544 n=1 Tax=Crassostrea virginica TaxID=6565 RepID=A0A8B8DL19_CRAVI|nr:uncharacterized protein LOC111127544 [Crassostrea virginica]XP_022328468.1 uncharacterized protein LOC111127545 [Crassostrea virginica]
MSASSMFLILVLAVLSLTGSANSQYYPQTYGQSLYSRPSPSVLLPNQQSDISVVIIPIILIVSVLCIVPILGGSLISVSSRDTMMKMMTRRTTTKMPTTTTTMTTTTTTMGGEG